MRSTSTTHSEYLEAYDLHADAVFRLCYAKTSNRDEATDMTQEVFVRVWERIQKNQNPIENLPAFIFTVARNLIKDYYKKKKSILEGDLPEGTFAQVGMPASQPDESEGRAMVEALHTLPDTYREVLVMHYVEGIPIQEIATLLHERPNTISVRVKRGIEKMREKFNTATV